MCPSCGTKWSGGNTLWLSSDEIKKKCQEWMSSRNALPYIWMIKKRQEKEQMLRSPVVPQTLVISKMEIVVLK